MVSAGQAPSGEPALSPEQTVCVAFFTAAEANNQHLQPIDEVLRGERPATYEDRVHFQLAVQLLTRDMWRAVDLEFPTYPTLASDLETAYLEFTGGLVMVAPWFSGNPGDPEVLQAGRLRLLAGAAAAQSAAGAIDLLTMSNGFDCSDAPIQPAMTLAPGVVPTDPPAIFTVVDWRLVKGKRSPTLIATVRNDGPAPMGLVEDQPYQLVDAGGVVIASGRFFHRVPQVVPPGGLAYLSDDYVDWPRRRPASDAVGATLSYLPQALGVDPAKIPVLEVEDAVVKGVSDRIGNLYATVVNTTLVPVSMVTFGIVLFDRDGRPTSVASTLVTSYSLDPGARVRAFGVLTLPSAEYRRAPGKQVFAYERFADASWPR